MADPGVTAGTGPCGSHGRAVGRCWRRYSSASSTTERRYQKRQAATSADQQTLRRLMRAVLDHNAGRLVDDATVLLAEWRGGHQRELTP